MICSHCGMEINSWCKTESRTYECKFNKDGNQVVVKYIKQSIHSFVCIGCGYNIPIEDRNRMCLEAMHPEDYNIK